MTFLCVPLKLSTEVDVVTPLRRFIAGKFGEAVASQCAKSLDKLSELRYEACFGEPKDLNRRMEAFALYHNVLWSLEKRLNTSEDLGIKWSWSDIWHKNYFNHYSFNFEQMNIIFCYAAIHSSLAKTYDLNCEHSLMKAISSYKIAAEAFEYLALHMNQSSGDMTQEVLTVFSDVMIAQANECNFLRLRNDEPEYRRIANHINKLYKKCLDSFSIISSCLQDEDVVKSVPEDWYRVIKTKQNYYNILSVTYLGDEKQKRKKDNKESSGLLVSKFTRSLSSRRWSETFQTVYETETNSESQPSPVLASDIVTKEMFQIPLPSSDPGDIFEMLVPFPVLEALNIANSTRTAIINSEFAKLKNADTILESEMIQHNFPHSLELSVFQLICETLLKESVKIQQYGGVDSLRHKIHSLKPMAEERFKTLAEIEEMLRKEESNDIAFRTGYANILSREPSEKLNSGFREKVDKLRLSVQLVSEKDYDVIALFKQHEADFQTLNMSNNELLVYIQSNFEAKEIGIIEEIENLRKDLIRIWDELIVNKQQRGDVIKMWDLVCLPPNFVLTLTKWYRTQGEINHNEVTSKTLRDKVDSARICVNQNLDEQRNLLSQLRIKSEPYFSQIIKYRQHSVISSLQGACKLFLSIRKDVEKSLHWHSEFEKLCTEELQLVNDFCLARSDEINQIISENEQWVSVTHDIESQDCKFISLI
ncbi:Programmed cell death 6-interacting protein isoform 1 [Schistosoma japonicum]|uniref:Programmed cell death 6-interacting protein isoform 1 n=2 Tax=Schistosoma japonicum TaxID=6182 RepID=A0A4Z2DXG4_SCHJA|nr:Programmed cell death 6-interacting protein isoform 1 [Schistosoma japonicum]